ncbi:unnamed protein product [Cylicostephanus goldi]|uniref:Uncharacterized protein n=1 Tax=Cylicostephanus goldi TaxID=71465 RepID=A0A3P6S334_CYLGO|nr:unnamed protein product [Cylicostephanus goldi]
MEGKFCLSQESINVLHKRVTGCGFRIEKNEIFTSLLAARNYVEQNKLRPMLILAKEAMEDFQGVDTSNPNAVVIGLAPAEFHFEKLNDAFKLVLDGMLSVWFFCGKYLGCAQLSLSAPEQRRANAAAIPMIF